MLTDQPIMRAFLNDPGIPGVKPEAVAPGWSVQRFEIPGMPQSDIHAPLQPGTLEFQASHLSVILSHAYDAWARYFGDTFDWVPGAVLRVIPRAGRDLNAYYDRRALKFFYATDPVSRHTLYTCESPEVAAHECGHAILDAKHPDYWNSLHPETGAFHEAFGDITALLTALQFPSVRARLLQETKQDLAQSNEVTRLAEQLGRALFVQSGRTASLGESLRDLVNSFRYRETWKLPARAPATRLSSESHSFSRIFSGAFYDILVGIYARKRQANPKLDPDDALTQARDEAGTLLAHALLLAPPGDAVFRVIALAMFKADQQRHNGQYFDILRRVFSRRRILRVKDADLFRPSHLGVIGSKVQPRRTSPLSSVALESGVSDELKRALRLRGEERIFTRELGRLQDQRVVQYTAQRMVPLKGRQFGPADGAWVPIQGGLTLNVTDSGQVAFSGVYRAGLDDVRAIRDHVAKLAERQRIYDACPGDESDIMHLITRRQPYFIDYDEAGNKVLRRAFIACYSRGRPCMTTDWCGY